MGLLQNLARYVFETGNVLGAGDHMDLFGPIALEESTEIRAAAFTLDPQLGHIDTPHGALAFIQVVGLTMDEYEAIRAWDTEGLLEIIRERDPLMVTDLTRDSYLANPAIEATVKERTAAQGSSMGELNIDRLAWEGDGLRLTVTIGAHGIERLGRTLEGRLPFGRTLLIRGEGSTVVMQPDETFDWHDAGEGTVHINVPTALGREIAAAVQPIAGTYDVGDRLRFVVERTIVRDQSGKEIGFVG